jgi:hypothetical protein
MWRDPVYVQLLLAMSLAGALVGGPSFARSVTSAASDGDRRSVKSPGDLAADTLQTQLDKLLARIAEGGSTQGSPVGTG